MVNKKIFKFQKWGQVMKEIFKSIIPLLLLNIFN